MQRVIRGAAALDYVIVRPDDIPDEKIGTVCFLHNRDANMLDFVRLAVAIDPHRYIYVFPNAPFADPDAPDRRRSWQAPGEPKAVSRASRAWPSLTEWLQHVDETVGAGGPRVIAGFSQGASFALQYGLAHPGAFAAIVALSPSRVADVGDGAPDRASAAAPAIFLAKGLDDPVVPVDEMRACRSRLERARHAVSYREYSIGHEISLAEVRDVRRWLRDVCSTAQPTVVPAAI